MGSGLLILSVNRLVKSFHLELVFFVKLPIRLFILWICFFGGGKPPINVFVDWVFGDEEGGFECGGVGVGVCRVRRRRFGMGEDRSQRASEGGIGWIYCCFVRSVG